MHQITAYGGYKGKAPFAQAVVQSPGWYPTPSNVQQEQTFNDFLARANVSSLADARKLSFETLQTANIRQIAASAYGTFAYGPAVDGDFAPALPGDLLLHGQYDTSLRLMLGHNGDEVVQSKLACGPSLTQHPRASFSPLPSSPTTPPSPNSFSRSCPASSVFHPSSPTSPKPFTRPSSMARRPKATRTRLHALRLSSRRSPSPATPSTWTRPTKTPRTATTLPFHLPCTARMSRTPTTMATARASSPLTSRSLCRATSPRSRRPARPTVKACRTSSCTARMPRSRI